MNSKWDWNVSTCQSWRRYPVCYASKNSSNCWALGFWNCILEIKLCRMFREFAKWIVCPVNYCNHVIQNTFSNFMLLSLQTTIQLRCFSEYPLASLRELFYLYCNKRKLISWAYLSARFRFQV
jgi:hypothetical protein